MKSIVKLVSLVFMFCSFTAHAGDYLYAVYGPNQADPNKLTHMIIVGLGQELGTLFQEAAATKAKKYMEIYPDDQVVVLSFDQIGADKNTEKLKGWGFGTVEVRTRSNFSSSNVYKEMSVFKKIKSLDVYSHAAPKLGARIDSRLDRFGQESSKFEKLKKNFVKGAHVTMQGCNTGYTLAPYISKVWSMPVFGSLTSTNFQQLFSDGQFYLNEPEKKPATGNWAGFNRVSFAKNFSCDDGACVRLKTDNAPYVGYWGDFNPAGGLSFQKVFCVTGSEEDCLKSMAEQMLTYVSTTALTRNSSIEDYEKVVFDYLCPLGAKTDVRARCEKALRAQDTRFNPFNGRQIQCDLRGCQVQLKCSKIPLIKYTKNTCDVINPLDENARITTLVDEYNAYMKAYKYLATIE